MSLVRRRRTRQGVRSRLLANHKLAVLRFTQKSDFRFNRINGLQIDLYAIDREMCSPETVYRKRSIAAATNFRDRPRTQSTNAVRFVAAGLPSPSLGICLLLAFQVLDKFIQRVETCAPELAAHGFETRARVMSAFPEPSFSTESIWRVQSDTSRNGEMRINFSEMPLRRRPPRRPFARAAGTGL